MQDDDSERYAAHRREQAEAAFIEAVGILRRHSENFVVYIRTGPGTYARQVEGRNHVERIAIASGVLADLNLLVSDVALVAAKQVDIEDEQSKQSDA